MTRGFRRFAAGPSVLFVEPEFQGPVLALGWLQRGGLELAMRPERSEAGAAGRATTRVIALPGRSERIHLRPLRHGGVLGRLWGTRLLGIGRAVEELRVTHELRTRGAPVARPILAIGERGGFFWSAAVGTRHETDAIDGVAFLRSPATPGERQLAARAAGRAVRSLHDCGGSHADLHAGNLLVRMSPGSAEVVVIDLDRAQLRVDVSPARRMRELMRLYRSLRKRQLEDRVGRRGIAAFFAAYVSGDRELRRALLAHAERERRRVRLHSVGYRIRKP